MDMIYKTDYDLLDFVFEEGQYVEPKNYLPIIPTVLTKQNVGVAVGYSMHNISYNPIDIIDACIDVINSRENAKIKIKTSIKPYINCIKSKNWKYEEGHWINVGEWKYNKAKDQIIITDLPYDTTYEDFEKLLCLSASDNHHCHRGTHKKKRIGHTVHYKKQAEPGNNKHTPIYTLALHPSLFTVDKQRQEKCQDKNHSYFSHFRRLQGETRQVDYALRTIDIAAEKHRIQQTNHRHDTEKYRRNQNLVVMNARHYQHY